MVVFPTPGPPVITVTLLPRAIATASRCEGESVRPVFCSTQGMARRWINLSPGQVTLEEP